MRKVLRPLSSLWIFLLLGSAALSPHNESLAGERPFKKAVVMSGAGLNWPLYMGVDEVLAQTDKDVDLVVGICGGSFAAAFSAIPGADWKRETYEISRSLEFTSSSVAPLVPFFLGMPHLLSQKRIPRFATYSIFNDVKESLLKTSLNRNFKDLSRPTIIVATRLLFDPYNPPQEIKRFIRDRSDSYSRRVAPKKVTAKWQGRKLFEVIFFTDPLTAQKLPRDLKPYALKLFPEIPFEENIKIRTDFNVAEAVRASISDPLFFEPAEIRGEYFLTGATENQPLEILSHLSDETIDSERGRLPDYQDEVYRAVFGFSSNAMGDRQVLAPGQHLLPLDYKGDLANQTQLTPRISKFLTWESAVPGTFEEFESRVETLSEFGRQQTLKSTRN